MEINLANVLGSSWLVPLFVIGSWALVKFLDGKFVTTQTFDNYLKSKDKETHDLKEELHSEARDNDNYIKIVDKKAQDNAKSISGLESSAESLEKAIDRIENRLDK